MVNVLTHFIKKIASELALTVQQTSKYICKNTLQLKTNLRNNRFKYYDKEYLVARLSIGQMFVKQIAVEMSVVQMFIAQISRSMTVSRSNIFSANRQEQKCQ